MNRCGMESSRHAHTSSVFPMWFYYLFNILGILPVQPSRAGELQFHWLTLIVGTIPTMWFIYCSIGYTFIVEPITSMREAVRVVGLYCLLLGAIVFFTATTANCWMKQFNRIVENLDSFQHFLESKTVCKNKGEKVPGSRVADVTVCITLAVFVVDFSCSMWENRNFEPMFPLTVNACDFYFLVIEILYVRVVWSLSQSFKELNKLVKFCNRDRIDIESRGARICTMTDLPRVTVEEVGNHHRQLVQTIKEINGFFGWQNLFMCGRIILGTVVNPVYIVTSWTGIVAVDTSIIFYVFSQSQRFLFRIVQFIIIASTTTYTTGQAKKTAFHVTRLLSYDLGRDTREEVKNVVMQINNSRTNFTVLGLFNLDLSLISLVIGMSISYTVMVLQLDYAV